MMLFKISSKEERALGLFRDIRFKENQHIKGQISPLKMSASKKKYTDAGNSKVWCRMSLCHNELKCGKKSFLAGQWTVCLKGKNQHFLKKKI